MSLLWGRRIRDFVTATPKFNMLFYPMEFQSIKIFDCTNTLFSAAGFARNWKK
jgi:hypothetical protein